MSWYVGLDGRQVWIERDETVYTLGDPPAEQELPLESLTYLASGSGQKAVYAEHMIDDDLGDGRKGKKKSEKMAGRQRGFVVRVDNDSRTRVTSAMQRAVDYLVDAKAVGRVDVDDPEEGRRKRKGKDKDKEKEREAEEEILPPLGPNECRVETRARCQHFAHGHGFRVDILELGSRQRLHMFTEQELPAAEWHQRLVAAVQATGGRVALGRMGGAEDTAARGGHQSSGSRAGTGVVAPAPPPPKKGAEAKEEEEDWMDTVFGQRMVPRQARPPSGAATEPQQREGGEGQEGGGGGEGGGEGGDEGGAAPPRKPAAKLPPWLRR